MIYHVVSEAELRAGLGEQAYAPASLGEFGFVHCAFEPSVLAVANDYFAGASGRVLLLAIDPARLTAEARSEAAAPIAGGGAAHLAGAPLFPHVYGPIDLVAIDGVGVLGRSEAGYAWPTKFEPLDAFLE